MPCLEISIPKLDADRKREMVAELTAEFSQATHMPPELFGIRFHEYHEEEASSGGKIVDENSDRPYIHFLLYCPRFKRSVKQTLVQSFTATCTRILDNPAWWPVIHICEHPYDNVGVEGQLLSDAYEECGKAEFYYELPKD